MEAILSTEGLIALSKENATLRARIAELEAREKRLRALAKFGLWTLRADPWDENLAHGVYIVAREAGLVWLNEAGPRWELTELAQLPEES